MKSRTGFCLNILLASFITLAMFLTSSAFASVTMLGNRIIYPSNAKSVDVHLTNNDAIPYIIQTWFDDGDVNSKPNQAKDIPFFATPPVFRIEPNSGQVVRIVFTGSKSLPQDRESVYWFNMLEIPPANVDNAKNQNKMLITLRSRVKLFYRPAEISAPTNILKGLTAKLVYDAKKGNGIELSNPQPWFASLTEITANVESKKHTVFADMINPYDKATFWFSDWKKRINGPITITVTAMNDQGAKINEQYKVSSK